MIVATRRKLAALLVSGTLGLGAATGTGPVTAGAAGVDVHAFVHGCHALRDVPSGRYVGRDAFGYHAGVSQRSGATPFRMQATGLGTYLLYGDGGRMPSTGLLNSIVATNTPGPSADWRLADGGNGNVSLTNVATGKRLGVGLLNRLGQSGGSESRWRLEPTTGCAVFPEIDTGIDGEPLRTTDPGAPVRGFLDAHTHLTAHHFLGGRFHCGRPWSPYGVAVALRDCADHALSGIGAVFENVLSTGSPIGTHSNDGWPSFAGWPRHDSLTHESTYWKWIERAWRGGLRVLVNDFVENRALCQIYPLKQNSCDEMESVRRQAADLRAMQDYIDAQYGGPGRGFFRIVTSPQEARQVIHEGKLAVVLGVEVSEVLGCGQTRGTPHCDRAGVDARLQELWDLGVRSFFPVHKFDNALGGTHFDEGTTGLLVNVGNFLVTGDWWRAEPCAPGGEPDNTPTSLSGNTALLYTLIGQVLGDQILRTNLPAYPPAPICNPRGLTDLGAYVIERMIERGFVIETDHLSVAARSDALDLIEAAGYSGLVTSHGWGDTTSQARLQALGGVVAPYARDATVYVESWAQARALHDPAYLQGFGYGSDNNGLGAQPGPRPGAAGNPVTYPFSTFDGGSTVHRQVSGSRTYDVNTDGVAHYGLFPDYIEDLRHLAGDEIVDDLANGAEAYLQMWERALG